MAIYSFQTRPHVLSEATFLLLCSWTWKVLFPGVLISLQSQTFRASEKGISGLEIYTFDQILILLSCDYRCKLAGQGIFISCHITIMAIMLHPCVFVSFLHGLEVKTRYRRATDPWLIPEQGRTFPITYIILYPQCYVSGSVDAKTVELLDGLHCGRSREIIIAPLQVEWRETTERLENKEVEFWLPVVSSLKPALVMQARNYLFPSPKPCTGYYVTWHVQHAYASHYVMYKPTDDKFNKWVNVKTDVLEVSLHSLPVLFSFVQFWSHFAQHYHNFKICEN